MTYRSPFNDENIRRNRRRLWAGALVSGALALSAPSAWAGSAVDRVQLADSHEAAGATGTKSKDWGLQHAEEMRNKTKGAQRDTTAQAKGSAENAKGAVNAKADEAQSAADKKAKEAKKAERQTKKADKKAKKKAKRELEAKQNAADGAVDSAQKAGDAVKATPEAATAR